MSMRPSTPHPGGRKRLSLQEELLAASRIGVVAVRAANRAASTERRHPSPSEKYLACVAAQKQREQGLLRRQKLEQGGKPAIFRRESVKTMASRKSNTRLVPGDARIGNIFSTQASPSVPRQAADTGASAQTTNNSAASSATNYSFGGSAASQVAQPSNPLLAQPSASRPAAQSSASSEALFDSKPAFTSRIRKDPPAMEYGQSGATPDLEQGRFGNLGFDEYASEDDVVAASDTDAVDPPSRAASYGYEADASFGRDAEYDQENASSARETETRTGSSKALLRIVNDAKSNAPTGIGQMDADKKEAAQGQPFGTPPEFCASPPPDSQDFESLTQMFVARRSFCARMEKLEEQLSTHASQAFVEKSTARSLAECQKLREEARKIADDLRDFLGEAKKEGSALCGN